MHGFGSYEKALYSGDVEATREMEARYDENPELAELDRYTATKESVDAAASGLRSFNGAAARTAGIVGALATGNLPLASAIVGAGGAAGNLAEGGTVGAALTEGAIEGVSNYAGGKLLELAGKGAVAGARRMARSLDDSLTWGGGTVDAADVRTPTRRRPVPVRPSVKSPDDTRRLPGKDFAGYVKGEPPGSPSPSDAEMSAMARAFGSPEPTTGFTPPWRADQGATTRWHDDLVTRYGKDRADSMLDVLFDDNFRRYFYGADPRKTLADIDKYREMRRIVNAVTEPNEIVLGGSAGISSEGTIFRGSAVPHDLDFAGYIADATRRADYGSEEATRAMVGALSDRVRIENSPVIRKLREMYPEARDATFHWPAYDWEIGGGYQYTPGVFTVIKASPDVSPGGRVTRTISTMLGGNKVDIMLQDGALGVSKTNPRLGSTETAFDWKRAYGAQRRKGLRPKDAADIERYRDYSEDNPVVDLGSHRAQHDPFAFADDLVDGDGMPRVFDMETFPGSGERVPVVMNTEGVILPLDRPRLLETYDPMHPQNMSRYADRPATAETHPLVAMRGANRAIRDAPGTEGEFGPNIGIYRADKPEEFVESVFKKGTKNWFTNPDGSYKDIVIYDRSAVDPKANISNRLWDQDAYTLELDRHTMSGLSRNDQRNVSNASFRKSYGWSSEIPMYSELGDAYRNRIYEQNPAGVVPDMRMATAKNTYLGYGEAMPARFTKDGVVIRGEEIARDPEGSKQRLLDAIMKMRFAAPAGLSVGVGVGAASTQQAAKGGEAGPGKRESTAPTDEQLQEAAAFLRLVVERGFAKTDDEIEKCERLARAIEAAVGAEPVEPREEPLQQVPLQPNEETQAAYGAGVYGGPQDDEDDPAKQIEKMTRDMFQEETDVAIRYAIVKDVTGQDPTEVNRSVNENAIAVARGETKGRLSPAGTAEITALGAYDEFMGDKETFKVNAEGTDYDMVASDPSKKGNLVAFNEALQAAKSKAEGVDTSHIKYGPQPKKTPTMDDVGKAIAAKHQPEVAIPGDDAPAQPVAPAQEQPVQQAAVQPQQETLAPGLSRSGSRNNILEYEGRRISQREFDRIQAKFQEGGPQQPTGIGGRTLTAGEAAWQAKRRASTEAWMQRTGQSAVADAGLPEAQPNAEPREEMDGLGGEGGGLVKSGSRGNILTYKGKRITDREARGLGLI